MSQDLLTKVNAARAKGNEFFQQTLSHYGFTSSSDSKCAFMAKLCPRSMSPAATAAFDCWIKLLDLIHHLLLRGAKLAPETCFRLFRPIEQLVRGVTLMRCLCSAGAARSWMGGSVDPPS